MAFWTEDIGEGRAWKALWDGDVLMGYIIPDLADRLADMLNATREWAALGTEGRHGTP